MTLESTHFDRTQLHPKAAAAIDADGIALLAAREVGTMNSKQEPSFMSRRVPAATLTDADFVGEPLLAYSNMSGQIVSRYFVRDGKHVALREEGFRQLRRVIEKILRAKPFSSGLSAKFVEIETFKWWRDTLREETRDPLSVRLLEVAAKAVDSYRMAVPLSNLEVERAFMLGDVLVTPFDPSRIDTFEREGIEKFPERDAIIR